MMNRKLTHTRTEGIYDIMDPARNTHGFKVIRPGDTLRCKVPGKRNPANFTISDVCSSSIESGHCPMEAYERAKRLGHKLMWMNEQAVTLSANRQPQKQVIEVERGEVIEYLSNHYEITFNRMGEPRLLQADH